MILRQLLEIRVDTEKFDLTQWQDDAEAMGYANDPGNGIYIFAENLADEHAERGLTFEVVPNDPYVGESPA